jgi:hypothetical protein
LRISSNLAGKAPPAIDLDLDLDLGDGTAGAAHAPEFAPTGIDGNVDASSDWWAESADGQCSENASLFAQTHSAPLNVV